MSLTVILMTFLKDYFSLVILINLIFVKKRHILHLEYMMLNPKYASGVKHGALTL